MARNGGIIKAILELDKKQFDREVKSAGRQVENLGKTVDRTGKRMSDIGGSMTKAITAPLLAGSGMALKLYAGIEQTATSFRVLTKDAGIANALIEQINQEAERTPYAFQELADSSKKLLAFGSVANEVTGEMRMLGDIASGISQPIGEIAEIYGKARVQGRLFMEDINQLTGRGIPVIGGLAKIFDVTQDKIKDLVSKGKVHFNDLQQAMKDMTSKGGLFFGMMEEQSKTLAGKWSTFLDSMRNRAIDFGETLDKTFDIKGLLDTATEGINRAGKAIKAFVEVNPDLTKTILKFGALAAAIGPVLLVGGKMVSFGGNLAMTFGALGIKLAPLAAGFVLAAAAIGSTYAITKALVGETEDLGTTVKRTALIAVNSFKVMLSSGTAVFKTLGESIGGYASVIWTFFSDGAGAAKKEFVSVFEALSKSSEKSFKTVNDDIDTLISGVSGSAGTIDRQFDDLGKGFADGFKSVLQGISGITDSVLEEVQMQLNKNELKINAGIDLDGLVKQKDIRELSEMSAQTWSDSWSKYFRDNKLALPMGEKMSEDQWRDYMGSGSDIVGKEMQESVASNLALGIAKGLQDATRSVGGFYEGVTKGLGKIVSAFIKDDLAKANFNRFIKGFAPVIGDLFGQLAHKTEEQMRSNIRYFLDGLGSAMRNLPKFIGILFEEIWYEIKYMFHSLFGSKKPERPSSKAADSFTNANFATGTAPFIVPPGYPNDTFRMGVQSGERVTVETPAQQRANDSSRRGSITYNLNFSVSRSALDDPIALKRVVIDAVRLAESTGEMQAGLVTV